MAQGLVLCSPRYSTRAMSVGFMKLRIQWCLGCLVRGTIKYCGLHSNPMPPLRILLSADSFLFGLNKLLPPVPQSGTDYFILSFHASNLHNHSLPFLQFQTHEHRQAHTLASLLAIGFQSLTFLGTVASVQNTKCMKLPPRELGFRVPIVFWYSPSAVGAKFSSFVSKKYWRNKEGPILGPRSFA